MTREDLLAEARAIHQCDYDERAGRPTEIEARLASEVVALLRERDEARARIARYVAALDAALAHEKQPATTGNEPTWLAAEDALNNHVARSISLARAHNAALAALRETPAGEGER